MKHNLKYNQLNRRGQKTGYSFHKYIYTDEDVLTSDATTDEEIIAALAEKKDDNIKMSEED